MNSSKSLLVLAAAFFAAGLAFAAEGTASKVAGCCTKAQAGGKDCAHACCVENAKKGDNCTKCGGAGKIEKTKK
jgi:hypothetical protein